MMERTMNPNAQYDARAPQPGNPSTLEGFNADINVAAKEISELRDRARSIADAYFGVAPSLGQTSGTDRLYVTNGLTGGISASLPSGRATMVRSALGDLTGLIASLRNEIDRLSCI